MALTQEAYVFSGSVSSEEVVATSMCSYFHMHLNELELNQTKNSVPWSH